MRHDVRVRRPGESLIRQAICATGAAISASATPNSGQLNACGNTERTPRSSLGTARSESAMNT